MPPRCAEVRPAPRCAEVCRRRGVPPPRYAAGPVSGPNGRR